jgi:hypothetical protein
MARRSSAGAPEAEWLDATHDRTNRPIGAEKSLNFGTTGSTGTVSARTRPSVGHFGAGLRGLGCLGGSSGGPGMDPATIIP